MASLLPWTDREKLSKGSSQLNAGADQYLNGILQYHYGMHNQNPAAYNAGAIAANVGEIYVCNRVTDQISGVAENGATGACRGGSGSIRPSWRQSELDAAKDFSEYAEQKSFINGQEVPYGTKGSVRPDLYKKGSSIDVKNYKIETASGRNNLAKNIEKQYYQRLTNLPDGTKQSALIDIRGQNVLDTDLTSLYNDISSRTNNGITIKFKTN